MKSGQHEPLGGGEAVVRYNLLSFLHRNHSFSRVSHWDTCLPRRVLFSQEYLISPQRRDGGC